MKKKIVVITNNFTVGGVERFLYDVLSRLDPAQLQITAAAVWGSGVLAEKYRKAGISVIWAGSHLIYNSKNPFLKLYFSIISPLTLLRLVVLIRRIQPDVVLTGLTQADILGIWAAWLCKVTRRVIYQGDVKPLQIGKRITKQIFAVNLSTEIVAVSEAVRLFLVSYFRANPTKIRIIPNGVELAKFADVAKQPITINQPVTGFLGRLEPIKGPQYLLKALVILKNEFGLIPRTLIFGDGSLREELEDIARQNNLAVEFKGQVLDPAMALREIDVLVVPSQSEGFGLVVLEGLAAGRIVVAADIPAIRGLIKPGDNGFFFPAENPQVLAKTLANLLDQPELLRKVNQQTHLWLATQGQQYSINRVAAAYQRFFLNG